MYISEGKRNKTPAPKHSMKKLTIAVEVSKDILEGVLDSASRGSSYWADGIEILGYESGVKKLLAGKELKIKDSQAEKGDRINYTLTLGAIEKGLTLMAKKSPEVFGELVGENYDDNTGDVLIQYALFGELIYG